MDIPQEVYLNVRAHLVSVVHLVHASHAALATVNYTSVFGR